MKKTLEQFGRASNYKGIRKTDFHHPLQDLWIEFSYLFYTLDICEWDHSSLGSEIYNAVWNHVDKNLRKHFTK